MFWLCYIMPATRDNGPKRANPALKLIGEETFDLNGITDDLKPQQDVTLTIKRSDGSTHQVTLLLRIDTPIEVDYYRHGGILPYVLRELVG